ncbi:MAG: hypothetical protein L0196_07110 [candidate division Zixibacteria bacterium]|nr:hypothetical protein [candidate division Zixibacteria bacterium]
MPQTKSSTTPTSGTSTRGISFCNWNDVCEPGVYVDTEYPRYFRVTGDSLVPNGSPTIHASGFTVAKISSDPMLVKSRIQHTCAENNLPVPQ